MEVAAALRRVKRSFGDEYAVVISDQDIFDWIYDAELDIIRHTSDNDITLTIPANGFPLNVPDRVNIKRLAVNGKALTYTTVSELDLRQASVSTNGGVQFWYFQGGILNLWPVPAVLDKYNVEVTYSKTPSPMSVVAPYLQWVSNPAALQYGLVASDNDWKNKTSVNIAVDMVLDSLNNVIRIITCGDATAHSTYHFGIDYLHSTALRFYVSDGTTSVLHTLNFLQVLKLGDRFRFRVTYQPATSTATLYRSDLNTGADILQSVSSNITAFSKQTTASAQLIFGASDTTTVINPAPSMRIYGVELRDSPDATGSTVFLFDGSTDLANLPGTLTTFSTLSGHSVSTSGGIVVGAHNQFVVPEVYHEDVVKFCLARAHNKNMNFRAAEAEMEQYDRRVSTRRNEAQAIDAPLYKIADPDDYVDYY